MTGGGHVRSLLERAEQAEADRDYALAYKLASEAQRLLAIEVDDLRAMWRDNECDSAAKAIGRSWALQRFTFENVGFNFIEAMRRTAHLPAKRFALIALEEAKRHFSALENATWEPRVPGTMELTL